MLGFSKLGERLFGSANDRHLRPYFDRVEAINALESSVEALSDDELHGKALEFRARLQNGETLDDILEEAFAVVREGARRSLGQRHFDVQLIGGMILHGGQIAEMKTGEGKTLVATLAVYLNAVEGSGVHVVTVNDYLAIRDSEWMGQIYNFLGLTVGCVVHGMNEQEKREAYAADVTYGTNNEYGFDYLRDNMAHTVEQMVQRPFNFAIVDEVDSILIDEARTPLIISGPTEDNSELYKTIDAFIPKLADEDYERDEKSKTVALTEEGNEHIEQLLRDAGLLIGDNLYEIENVSVVHHVTQALRAHTMFQLDRDYIIKDDKVVIIDEFTGRMMEGRRYSEGLHQALEAKEKVDIQNENQTLASVTFQNYFRLYPKLAGMTGTATTEEEEFQDIYGLAVAEIPTNMPLTRLDEHDEVYRTAPEKYNAIIEQVAEAHEKGQPTLVGTVSIEKSEYLADLLKKRKIPHNVLNARYHENEAHIIAQAGRLGAVTIATNMAGRGTDIQLGGNRDMRVEDEASKIEDDAKRAKKIAQIEAEIAAERLEVIAAGGLFVMGTERHESRRIDNQLRGRAGRQGDAGASKFYLSLEDDLMRIFGSERMDKMLVKLGLEEGEAIVHPWINKALEKAQMKVEQRNFDMRKNVLKYDDVMNDQRKAIYEQRREMMESTDVSDVILDMRLETIEKVISQHIPPKSYPDQWDTDGLKVEMQRIFMVEPDLDSWVEEDGIDDTDITDRLIDFANRRMAERAISMGPDLMRALEKMFLIQVIDQHWKEHLLQLDHLRQTVGLRAYGQRDPLNEYKAESFEMFQVMLQEVRAEITYILAHATVGTEGIPDESEEQAPPQNMQLGRGDPAFGDVTPETEIQMPIRTRVTEEDRNPNDPRTWGKVARNAQCPCGSGKKFKHCHGAIVAG
ncbi:MAG: preprotein translocase subunit SecA [Alphaproteobacteria bacterium]|nr:MAG: preprotein translocase subunit SecA [Alphaproteobacteria bacterium]